MGDDAIQEWQLGVVAIGTRNQNLPDSDLVGSGFIVDLQSGLIVTCAHVVLDAFNSFRITPGERGFKKGRLNPGVEGVAIGVGIGEEVKWVCRGELRYISRPPFGYRGPPSDWAVKEEDHEARLDLAVLQLVELDGSSLRRMPKEELARGGRNARALSLGVPPPTPRSVPLEDGTELVMLGYGQSDSGIGAEQTSTTMRGYYAGRYSSNGLVPGSLQSGDWLKVDVTILSGHSGGPVVNRVGEVVGWAVMSDQTARPLGQLRPIASLELALRSVLKQPCCNTPAGVQRDVTGELRAVLKGAIAPGEFQLGNEELQRCHDAARRAEQSAQNAHQSAQDAHQHAQGARADKLSMQTQLQAQAQLQAASTIASARVAQVEAEAARLKGLIAQEQANNAASLLVGLSLGAHGEHLALPGPDEHGASQAVAASEAMGDSGVRAAMKRSSSDGIALQAGDSVRQRCRSLPQDVAGFSAELPGSRLPVFTEHLPNHFETPGLDLNTPFVQQPQNPHVNCENASLLPVEEASLGSDNDCRPDADVALQWAANVTGIGGDTLKTCKRVSTVKKEPDSLAKRLLFSGIKNLPAPIEINLPAPIDVVSLMTTLTQLERLDLSGCIPGLNGAQIRTLSDVLCTCRLVTLDLSDNHYNQEEAVPLIESLPSTITELALDYRVESQDPDPCKLYNALKQQIEDGSALKSLTLKVTIEQEPRAVPEELISAFVSLVKLPASSSPALKFLHLKADFSRRPNGQPFGKGGMKVFREAVKGRDPSTPLVLELPEYDLCNPCRLVRMSEPHETPFFPYWEWDQWARCADGCADWYGNLGPCARNALGCVQCLVALLAVTAGYCAALRGFDLLPDAGILLLPLLLPLLLLLLLLLVLSKLLHQCCCSRARFRTKTVISSVEMHEPTEDQDAEGEQQALVVR